MDDTKSSSRIPTLDGFRAIAVLTVIISHIRHIAPWVVALGHLGVYIFFALSGFLITDRLIQEYENTGAVSLRRFYIRRAFRILPPALVFLATVGVLAHLKYLVCDPKAIFAALFFYTNYSEFGDAGWKVGHFWSLSLEEHFYLIWPVLLIATGVKRSWRVALALSVATSLWRVADDHFHWVAGITGRWYLDGSPYRTDLNMDVLLWGCCLAFVLRTKGARLGGWAATGICLLSVCALVALTESDIPHVGVATHVLPALIVGSVVSCPNCAVGRVLEWNALKFTGTISYSLYIWQQLWLGATNLPLPIDILCIFACAYGSYKLVERPFYLMGKRMTVAPRNRPSNTQSGLSQRLDNGSPQ